MGNSEILLKEAMRAFSSRCDAAITFLRIPDLNIAPCISCGYCRSDGRGLCRIKDDFGRISRLLDKAAALVVSSPIYFYGLPAQFKALVDRSQCRWTQKKYFLKKRKSSVASLRPAYTLLVGATHGKKLFDGAIMTLKYFYDVWGFSPSGFFLVRGIDEKGEIKKHPRALAMSRRLAGFYPREKIKNDTVIMKYEAP